MTHPRIPDPFVYAGRLDGGRFRVDLPLTRVDRLRGLRRGAVLCCLAAASVVGRRDPAGTDRWPGRALRRIALRLVLESTEGLSLDRWQDGATGSVLSVLLPEVGLPIQGIVRRGLRRSHLDRSSDGSALVFTDDGMPPTAPLCLRPSTRYPGPSPALPPPCP